MINLTPLSPPHRHRLPLLYMTALRGLRLHITFPCPVHQTTHSVYGVLLRDKAPYTKQHQNKCAFLSRCINSSNGQNIAPFLGRRINPPPTAKISPLFLAVLIIIFIAVHQTARSVYGMSDFSPSRTPNRLFRVRRYTFPPSRTPNRQFHPKTNHQVKKESAVSSFWSKVTRHYAKTWL